MKALIVASTASMIDQFNMPFIELLQDIIGYQVDVACNFEFGNTCSQERIEHLKKQLIASDVNYYQIDFARNPFRIVQNLRAYKQLNSIIKDGQYNLIHCHSPIGGVVTRLVARGSGAKVIYTAHGFHFYRGAPLFNWLVYFPVEWLCSWLTDVLITINQEDYAFAQKHMHAKKIEYVPGVGIDLEKFNKNLPQSKIEKIRQSLGVQPDEKIFLSVGELIKRKNHEIVIRALAKLNNPRLKYFIVGRGELQAYLEDLVVGLGLQNQVKLLGYRDDISELLNVSDLFVFSSHQEGLPVALMEAISCKIPVACSRIRGNEDLVAGGVLFDQNSVDSVVDKINAFLDSDCGAEVESNYRNLQKFSLENVLKKMKKVYKGLW